MSPRLIQILNTLPAAVCLLALIGCNGPKDYGTAAPFYLENSKGQSRALQSYGIGTAEAAGENYLLINFWASWCKPCIKEIPLLEEYADSHRDQMTVIGIAVDRIESAKAFAQRLQISYPVLFGEHTAVSELMRAYGNRRDALPYTVLVSPAGQIIWKHTGLLRAGDLQRLPLPTTNTE